MLRRQPEAVAPVADGRPRPTEQALDAAQVKALTQRVSRSQQGRSTA